MNAVEKPEREFYSPSRIAHENDISIPMVHKLIRERVLEGVRFQNRLVRVTAESYKRFLKTRTKVV